MSLATLFEYTGLGAALIGVLFGLRGLWSEVVGCSAVVTVCSVLAAAWKPTE